MKASIVDLRYKMREILKALDRNESVSVLYHGTVKGVIVPAAARHHGTVKEHPFFGMTSRGTGSVEGIMKELRGGRHHDV